MQSSVKAQCVSCSGTGVYRGFAEPEGVGVVCVRCRGTGCESISFTPFEGRKRRNDIRRVHRSAGTFIGGGVGPTGDGVAYDDFLNGTLPR